MNEMTDFFGEVISSYSTEQAIDDGVLAHPYPERWPWLLITGTVHELITNDDDVRAERRTYEQALVPLLMDAIMIAQDPKNRGDDLLVMEGTIAGTVWLRPNEKGGLTIMKPQDN